MQAIHLRLLDCLRVAWHQEPLPLAQVTDSEALAHAAGVHGAAPLLYRALKVTRTLEVPAVLVNTGHRAHTEAAARAALQVCEIERLQNQFRTAAIPVLFYNFWTLSTNYSRAHPLT